jgi:hypothetical protein
VLGGCAKDRTLEDYQNSKAEEDLIRMRAHKGDYRGTLASRDGGQISVITIQVDAERLDAKSSGTAETKPHSALKVSVALAGVGGESLRMTFNNGSYDRATQYFRAAAAVTGRGTVTLSGVFEGDALSGVLEAEGYPERGGTFHLVRNQEPPQAVVSSRSRVIRENDFLYNSYSGMGTFRIGPPSEVHMSIVRHAALQEQDFADLILPYRLVDLSIYFETVQGDGTIYRTGGVFSNAVWDITNQRLSGEYTSPSIPGQIPTILSLSCDEVDGPSGRRGWSCQEHSGGFSIGEVFRATFLPKAEE